MVAFPHPARDTLTFSTGMALGLLAGATAVLVLGPDRRRGTTLRSRGLHRLSLRFMTH